jgi:hypothetical protein
VAFNPNGFDLVGALVLGSNWSAPPNFQKTFDGTFSSFVHWRSILPMKSLFSRQIHWTDVSSQFGIRCQLYKGLKVDPFLPHYQLIRWRIVGKLCESGASSSGFY